MSHDLTRRRLLAGTGLAAVAGLAGCVASGRSESETVTETYDLDGVSALSVDNRNGNVTVTGEDRDDVELRGEKAGASEEDLDTIRLESTRNGDTLELSVHHDGDGFVIRLGPSPKMDLELAVPNDLRVARVGTVNGDVDATSITGDVSVETTNGNLTLTDVRGDVDAETTNGNVEAVGIDGDVDAETTNGNVTARDVTGRVVVDTTNGDVDTENVSGGVTQE